PGVKADLGIPQLPAAVLKLLPLDTHVESPAAVMDLVPSNKERGLQSPLWKDYGSLLLMAGYMVRQWEGDRDCLLEAHQSRGSLYQWNQGPLGFLTFQGCVPRPQVNSLG
uniref:Uncharacterized protein n=1 Tax=Sciurus vulgaris TaxID=55149 RepID=A0A8D2D5X3_SCIVU